MKPNRQFKRHAGAGITRGQVTAIKMGQKQLGIDDETYRDILWTRYDGATSCLDLNFDQAKDLIEDFVSRGFVLVQPESKARKKRQKQSYPPRPPRGDKKVIALATKDEIDKVNAIAALIEWRVENGLERFLAARMGIKDGKVRTSRDAYLAIEGLKKLFENYMKKLHGPNWWIQRFDDPGIMTYIAEHKPAEYR